MQLIRLFVIGFIGLSVVYALMFIWLRSLRRERLENEWDSGRAPHTTRDRHIADGMAQFRRSTVVRLLWGVYVLPLVALGVVIYINNHL